MEILEIEGLRIRLCVNVYVPAEDSFLLAKAVSGIRYKTCLELGCGTGIIAMALAKSGNRVVATDLNPFAVECTKANAKENGVELEVLQSDMFQDIKGAFDVIVFNPPYLPTTDEERFEKWHDMATDGGLDGLKHTRRFLEKTPSFLRPNGEIYTVISSLSPKKAIDEMLEPFEVLSMGCEKHFFEKITVFRLRPKEKV